MEPKFNLNRPKISDEEINKNKDFDNLVKQFKEQSIQRARSDVSFFKNKKATYAAVIAGIAVVCTVTYLTVSNRSNKQTATNEKTNTLTENKKPGTRKTFISPPSQKLNVPYNSYKVNNAKGGELAHHTSTKLKIPKNAFVNKAGEQIVGDVEIQYREFHDQADIIASGIPMRYDSAGTSYTFESAGMFDVKGFQNGEEVFISPAAPITIEFASEYPTDTYNQYYLDTAAQKWNVIKHDTPSAYKNANDRPPNVLPQAQKSITEKNIEKKIEYIPKKIDSVKTVYDKKIVALPSPQQPGKPTKPTGRPQINLDVDFKDFPELVAFKNVLFEVGNENKNYSKEISQTTWNSAIISAGPQKGKNYILTLKNRTREEKFVVYPVLTGECYETAAKVYEKKFNEYNTLLDKRAADGQKLKDEMAAKQKAYVEEQKKLSAELLKEQIRVQRDMEAQYANQNKNAGVQNKVLRVFQVSNFGIYNSDCPRSMPKGPVIQPDYYSSTSVPLDPTIVYLVDMGSNIVYNMSNNSYSFMYDTRKKYSLCIVAGGSLYVCNNEQFNSTVKQNSRKFIFKSVDAENIADFKKALEI
ncbi:MAG TPA: OmpH family outer membrane protein [Bacteroidia bacterium]|jgi:hypothetical protein|nr:OmpH family outer membrane protein [Bacteroidia bacterium]